MVISINGIKKSFNGNSVIENASFIIEEKEKYALIGVNGAGKSTLLKIVTGEEKADDGEIIVPNAVSIGYFSQNLEIDSSNTVYNELLTVFEHIVTLESEIRNTESEMSGATGEKLEEIMKKYDRLSHEFEEKNGYEYRSRLRGVIKGLGFSEDESNQPINELSGGQKTRVALGKILLCAPDLLLLDEPTNHLDIESVRWLEDFIKSYEKAVLIVSHDRYFINRTTNKIIELENGKSHVYSGNYSFYAKEKERNREVELKHFLSQQKEIKKQEEVIKKLRSFNREKSIKRAESREKMLEKADKAERPENLPDNMRLSLTHKKESGNDVLTVTDLSKSFTDEPLFENISFQVKKGEKVALIGANGIGKTTIFKIILKRLNASEGKAILGTNVDIGYYDQEHATLDKEATVFDYIHNCYPTMTGLEIRNALARFVFKGDDVYKKISELSGGERGRVALAQIMLSQSNFLLLDEPTNHLDIVSKEILESALREYDGTCLFISHDRYFINAVAQKIVELKKDCATTYIGDYDYYMERITAKKEEEVEIKAKTTEVFSALDTSSKADWKKQKEEQAQQRKKENAIRKIEEKIVETETAISQTDEQLCLEEVYSDPSKSKEVMDRKSQLEEELAKLYIEWENLSE